jgi:hypothetical protein
MFRGPKSSLIFPIPNVETRLLEQINEILSRIKTIYIKPFQICIEYGKGVSY